MTMEHSSCFHKGYGLTCAEYDDLRRIAGGSCMLCKAATARLEIDHDHAVGQWAVRGLICRSCNSYLGRVDCGRVPRSAVVDMYLANAWHISQPSSATKAARARPRAECPACGKVTAISRDGRNYGHYSLIIAGYVPCSGQAA